MTFGISSEGRHNSGTTGQIEYIGHALAKTVPNQYDLNSQHRECYPITTWSGTE